MELTRGDVRLLDLAGRPGLLLVATGEGSVVLTPDELRWLALVAAPAFLSQLPLCGAAPPAAPSEPATTIPAPDQLALTGEGAT